MFATTVGTPYESHNVHASSRTTEVVYRRELRPVITIGAEVMDQIFQPKQRQGAPAEAAG